MCNSVFSNRSRPYFRRWCVILCFLTVRVPISEVDVRPISPSDVGRGRQKKKTPVTPLHSFRSSIVNTPIGSSSRQDHFFYSSRQAWRFEPDWAAIASTLGIIRCDSVNVTNCPRAFCYNHRTTQTNLLKYLHNTLFNNQCLIIKKLKANL